MKTPIDGARLSSGYGRRIHPILGYSKMHKGIDFAAKKGTPIYAAGDGFIERANVYGSYGKYIRIRHNAVYKTAYAHLNKFAKKILEAWYAEPKYPVGSYVVVRDTAPGMVRGKAKNAPCVILKTNAAYPRCAAKGTKIYQILPFGSPAAIMVEERYVKKARKVGGA